MIASDIFKSIGRLSSHTLSIYQYIRDLITAVRSDGEGLIQPLPDTAAS